MKKLQEKAKDLGVDTIAPMDPSALGAGGCRICKKYVYPEPCRFPEKAMSSMEGYGLFVSQVCRDGGVAYYHGEKPLLIRPVF